MTSSLFLQLVTFIGVSGNSISRSNIKEQKLPFKIHYLGKLHII